MRGSESTALLPVRSNQRPPESGAVTACSCSMQQVNRRRLRRAIAGFSFLSSDGRLQRWDIEPRCDARNGKPESVRVDETVPGDGGLESAPAATMFRP